MIFICIKDYEFVCCKSTHSFRINISLSQNLKSIVFVELDDGGALGLGEAVVVKLHHIVDGFLDFLADVAEGHGGGLAREVGRGGSDGLAEAADDLLAEVVVHHADAHRTVGGDVLREVLALGEDDAQGVSGVRDKVIGNGRHIHHIVF